MATRDAGTIGDILALYEGGRRNFEQFEIVDDALDFSTCDLTGIDLSSQDLSTANFTEAILTMASFDDANLSAANLAHADLTSTRFARANLTEASLQGAEATGANLNAANLYGADLTLANFSDASLVAANLRGARLESTNLFNANLINAHLEFALFNHSNLSGVRGRGAFLRDTLFLDVDVSAFCTEGVLHEGPSHVNFQSIVRSVGHHELKQFLLRTGMPDVFVEYMVDCARSLEPRIMFSLLQSTFISYGGPDRDFARKLNIALEQRGVRTFFFEDDAIPGERLHRLMRKGVNEYDRVILVCSQASLERPGLLNELQETLAREARDGGRTYLLPVRLDNYVIDGWRPPDEQLASAVRDRVIADFRAHSDADQFNLQVLQLVGALKKPFK